MKQTLLLLLYVLPSSLWAQQTGNYDKAIEFMGSTRLVSIYVPENYDPKKQYPMYLGLHGFGQSTYSIRGALQPIAKTREAIVICPSGNGDRHDDEFPANENGASVTKEIGLVHVTLDSALRWFSIDPTSVVLTGFSYGGREALYFGLKNYFKFQGIIGLSPAVQSLADVNNNFAIPEPNPFAYENQGKIPVCICAGEQDDYFIEFIKAMNTKLGQNEGADTLLLNPSGHTVFYPEFTDDFNTCLDFIVRNKVVASTSLRPATERRSDHEIRINKNRLSVTTAQDEPCHVRILSLNGKLVHAVSTRSDQQISTSGFPSGNYIIQVLNNTSCQSSIQYLP